MNSMQIEEVRKVYFSLYKEHSGISRKLLLKAWLNHSESRNKNGNQPFTLSIYEHHVNDAALLQQVELGMLDCGDIGGKVSVVEFLKTRIGEY